jgi:voltage-gated potassium channel
LVNSKLQKSMDIALMVFGFVYLAIYSFEVLAKPDQALMQVVKFVSEGIFVLFALDLFLRLFLSRKELLSLSSWGLFLKTNWLSLLALAAPMLRSLALLRFLVVLRGIAPFIQSRVSRLVFYIGVAFPLVIYTASIAVLEAEQGSQDATITSFSDALWWSLVTVTTVGFGDEYPVTAQGRLVGSVLIFVGIGLFSTFTALIASWVLDDKR